MKNDKKPRRFYIDEALKARLAGLNTPASSFARATLLEALGIPEILHPSLGKRCNHMASVARVFKTQATASPTALTVGSGRTGSRSRAFIAVHMPDWLYNCMMQNKGAISPSAYMRSLLEQKLEGTFTPHASTEMVLDCTPEQLEDQELEAGVSYWIAPVIQEKAA